MLLPIPEAKRILDRLKRTCVGRDLPDAAACARFDKTTKQREACAMPSAPACRRSGLGSWQDGGARGSLPLRPGGTHVLKGEIVGSDDLEVLAYVVVLAAEA